MIKWKKKIIGLQWYRVRWIYLTPEIGLRWHDQLIEWLKDKGTERLIGWCDCPASHFYLSQVLALRCQNRIRPRKSYMVVSPNSSICRGKKITARMRASLFQITLYIFWGWFYGYRAVECLWIHQRHILSSFNTNPKCVIHVSMIADPCVCRVKSDSFVAMVLFQRCLTFPLHLNCPSISCSPFERS